MSLSSNVTSTDFTELLTHENIQQRLVFDCTVKKNIYYKQSLETFVLTETINDTGLQVKCLQNKSSETLPGLSHY